MINTNQTGSSACQGAKTLTLGRAKSHRASWAYLLTGSAPLTTTSFGHWHIPSGGTGAGGSADAWALTRQTTMDLGQLTETHRPRSVGLEAANVSGRGTSPRHARPAARRRRQTPPGVIWPTRTPAPAAPAGHPGASPASGHLLRWPPRPPAGLVFAQSSIIQVAVQCSSPAPRAPHDHPGAKSRTGTVVPAVAVSTVPGEPAFAGLVGGDVRCRSNA